MRKELGKSLLKIIGFGIISSPLALIGHMYYSSTQVDRRTKTKTKRKKKQTQQN